MSKHCFHWGKSRHLHGQPGQPYLRAGDGDPLQAILAHQVLKGQLQLDLCLACVQPRRRPIVYGNLERRRQGWGGASVCV